MTDEALNALIAAAQEHGEPLRMSSVFYPLVAMQLHLMYQEPLPEGAPPRPELVIVSDGSENVQLVEGIWTFVPST